MFKKLFFFSILTLLLQYTQINANPNQIEIVLQVSDTTVSTGVENGRLSVYLDNFVDEIFGFQFVLISDRPDLMKFDFSESGFDVSGTLLEDFEYIEAIDIEGDQSKYWFRCIANVPWVIGHQNGVLPPQQGGLALKIPFTTTNSPDTTLPLFCDLFLGLPTDFSDPFGNSIGVIPDTVVDTSYFFCTEWDGPFCVTSIEVGPDDEYDFIVLDSNVVGLLDSTIVQVIDGSVTLEILNCDLDGSGFWDIADLVCLVGYMFNPEGPNCPLIYCETDLDGSITIGDLVYFVNYMFAGGSPPPEL